MAKSRPLTKTELKRLKAMTERSPQLTAMIQLGLCGCRVGEIANLKWKQVLVEDPTLLYGELQPWEFSIREVVLLEAEQSKNGKAGHIYLTKEAQKALRNYWLLNHRHQGYFPVFRTQRSHGYSPNSLAQKLNKLLADCGINTSSHSLRKTFACEALRAGATIETCRLLLRQSCISVTQKYLQDFEQDTAEIVANLKIL